MTYILPVLYVIVSYTFFLLAVHFGNAITLQIVSILLPFIMGIVNLIVVLTVGRKWSRKTLLNCTLIIKYGLIHYDCSFLWDVSYCLSDHTFCGRIADRSIIASYTEYDLGYT